MSKQLDARSIRVLEDALSEVVRDANAATKDLRGALNDYRTMIGEVVREKFEESITPHIDDVMTAVFERMEELTVKATEEPLNVMKRIHAELFADWEERDIVEVLRVARMIVATRDKLREVLTKEEMNGGAEFDPLEFLSAMGDSSVKLIAKQINAGVTYSGVKWETIDVKRG